MGRPTGYGLRSIMPHDMSPGDFRETLRAFASMRFISEFYEFTGGELLRIRGPFRADSKVKPSIKAVDDAQRVTAWKAGYPGDLTYDQWDYWFSGLRVHVPDGRAERRKIELPGLHGSITVGPQRSLHRNAEAPPELRLSDTFVRLYNAMWGNKFLFTISP